MLSDAFKLAAILAVPAALALHGCERAAAPRFEVIATTYDGNEYVAGSGDNCRDAYRNAVMPADWREVVCRESI